MYTKSGSQRPQRKERQDRGPKAYLPLNPTPPQSNNQPERLQTAPPDELTNTALNQAASSPSIPPIPSPDFQLYLTSKFRQQLHLSTLLPSQSTSPAPLHLHLHGTEPTPSSIPTPALPLSTKISNWAIMLIEVLK
jgi:hypothetical protein